METNKKILTEIPKKKDIIIWATDNNGQIERQDDHTGGEEILANNAHIGAWHYANKSEKGMG